jgi:hypothetical protein
MPFPLSPDWTDWQNVSTASDAPAYMSLLEAIEQWALRYQINVDWVKEAAFATLIFHQGFLHAEEGPRAGEVTITRVLPQRWFPIDHLGQFRSLDLPADWEPPSTPTKHSGDDLACYLGEPTPPTAGSMPSPPSPPWESPRISIDLNGPSFVFLSQAWDPLFESWSAYRSRIQADFGRDLTSYRKRREQLARAQGAEPAPAIPNPESFRWLAAWQCAGLPVKNIQALRVRRGLKNVDDSAIRHGIEKAAKFIGLSRRIGSPGPRRKT